MGRKGEAHRADDCVLISRSRELDDFWIGSFTTGSNGEVPG